MWNNSSEAPSYFLGLAVSFFVFQIFRADQFDYVMYGKVYKIEGDETSTEAATRLWVTFAKYSIWATI